MLNYIYIKINLLAKMNVLTIYKHSIFHWDFYPINAIKNLSIMQKDYVEYLLVIYFEQSNIIPKIDF